MYLVVFLLLLWTLFQCILCKNCLVKSPDPNTLYVLSVQNDTHKRLSYRTLKYYITKFDSDIYNIERKTDCPGQLQGALKLTKNMRYVIYYGITDFYEKNYNDVRNSNMERAGDYGGYKEQLICTSDESISMDLSPIRDIKERANANCSWHQRQEYTMLISKYINFEETPGLYNLIRKKFSKTNDERSKKYEYNIIFCNDAGASNIIIYKDTFKTIRVQYFDTCKYGISYVATPNVIAIIAPDPEYVENLNSYADKPIIFYDAMNNYQMVDMYKNAIIRKTELKDEVRTLWNLISHRWKRVAILSDGSAESAAFENEVRTLFELKEVSYTVRSVEGRSETLGFNEALSSLQSVDARIIIANVDQKYADLLVKLAQKKGMTRNQNIIWITRAWSKATCLRAAKDLQAILTVTVESKPDDALRAIEIIKKLFKQDYEYSAFLIEAKFAQDIRKKYLKYHKDFHYQVIKTESSGQQHKGINQAIRNMPSDRGECTLRSDNFERPCDDVVGIMIALVIVVFAVSVLGITYFFDEPYTPYNRMAN